MDRREERGRWLARHAHIQRRHDGEWNVPSKSNPGRNYIVRQKDDRFTCTCQDFETNGNICKHIHAVRTIILKAYGKNEVFEFKRPTYPQNWSAYNQSQTQEKEVFLKLLSDLCNSIEEPEQALGRPKVSTRDAVFASTLKVYTMFSLRRFMSDLRDAKDKNYVKKAWSFSAVSKYMRKESLTPVIQQLITLSSLPLKSVETSFAIDSSGFRTTRFSEYCKEKHETDQEHEWVKMHVCVGVKTNIITAVDVGRGASPDNPYFIPLTQKTLNNGFNIQEVSADKGYHASDNYSFIDSIGGTAYIPFKTNVSIKTTGRGFIWRKMFNYFTFNREEFLKHYHLRSNVEATFSMIKSKFTDLIRSKDETAQKNEALLKALCHNIVVLIHEINELGIPLNQ